MPSSPAPETVESPTDIGVIRHYHAHIYCDPASRRNRAAAAFPEATLGRWQDGLVGPHLQSMYQFRDHPFSLGHSLPDWRGLSAFLRT
jgi:DOPA 4,5-dioxygenase